MARIGRFILLAFAGAAAAQTPPADSCGPSFTNEVSAQHVSSTYRAAPTGLTGLFRTGQPADLMLSGFGFNKSGGALLFRYNSGIASDGVRLFLADRGNNRVLIWNQLPASNRPPDLVLGQPGFETNYEGSGRQEMNWPVAVATGGGKLVVADTYNDRLLIWNQIPAQNGAPADIVISIRWPWGVWTDGERLVATSTSNGMASVWTNFPTRDNEPAAFHLWAGGDFGTPRGITSDGERLIIGDHNPRVTENGAGDFVWKTFPTRQDQPYDYFMTDPMDPRAAWLKGSFLPDGRLAMLGRTLHLWNSMPDGPSTPASLSIRSFPFSGGDASDIACAGGRLYVSAANGNRVLVYNAPPSSDQPPDFAIGSPDRCTNTLAANYIITNPVPTSNGTSLFVSSDFDRKLYIWNRLPDESGAWPNVVFSLPDAPWQNAVWGNNLLLAGGRAVYVWKQLPLEGQLPDVIIRDRIGPIVFEDLRGVAYDGRYLYLSDAQAGRVYIWDGIPSPESDPLYILRVEQPGRLSTDGKWLAVTATEQQTIHLFRIEELNDDPRSQVLGGPGRFNLPGHASLYQGSLFVADTVNNRTLVWYRVEDALTGRDPDAILGSADRRPSVKPEGAFWPGAVSFDGSYLWVGEFKFSGRLRRYALQTESGAAIPGLGPGVGSGAAPAGGPAGFNVLAERIMKGTASDDDKAEFRKIILDMKSGKIPWPWQDQIYVAYSEDGLRFSASRSVILKKAAAPEAVVDDSGQVWLFYTDLDLDKLLDIVDRGAKFTNGLTGIGAIGAARSADGVHFEPVDIEVEGMVMGAAAGPDIYRAPDGTYQMYYLGVPAMELHSASPDPANAPGPHKFYVALSNDLIHWEQAGVAWTGPQGGSDPAVYETGEETLYILAGGSGKSTNGGFSFSSVPKPSGSWPQPDVVAVPGGYRMYYSAPDGGIRSAFSTDGLEWVEDEGRRLGMGQDPTVVRMPDGTYRMYYRLTVTAPEG